MIASGRPDQCLTDRRRGGRGGAMTGFENREVVPVRSVAVAVMFGPESVPPVTNVNVPSEATTTLLSYLRPSERASE